MNKTNFEVYEDNAGGLYLIVLEDEKPVAAFQNFEYQEAGVLVEAIADVEYYEMWDNAMENFEEVYEDLSSNSANDLVADQDGIYPERMGSSAARAFNIAQ